MADFDQSAKGGPFAKFSKKWPIFLADAEFIRKLLRNDDFFKGYSKWPILTKVQIGDPLQNSQKMADFFG